MIWRFTWLLMGSPALVRRKLDQRIHQGKELARLLGGDLTGRLRWGRLRSAAHLQQTTAGPAKLLPARHNTAAVAHTRQSCLAIPCCSLIGTPVFFQGYNQDAV